MKDPEVRTQKHKVENLKPYKFNHINQYPLSKPIDKTTGFLTVLNNRKTIRDFKQIELQELGQLLFLSNRTISFGESSLGHSIQHRPTISAGALHSIEILFWMPQHSCWFHYNPTLHCAEQIEINSVEVSKFVEDAYSLLEKSEEATLFWYVCDLSLLKSKYKSPLSLAYRDCGAILATHSLTSEYLKLSYCPIGLTGGVKANNISQSRQFIGVGAALIGERQN